MGTAGKNNQITYTVKKTPVNQKVDLFVMIQLDEFMNALNDLSGNAFKLWAYMAKNKADYTEQLSSKNAMEKCRFAQTAYNNGITELKEKGYLINDNIHHNENLSTNYWLFYASPQKEQEKKQIGTQLSPTIQKKLYGKPPPLPPPPDDDFIFD